MTVDWTAEALDELAHIYTFEPTHEDRERLAQTVETINARLAVDPWFLGESRGTRRRVWFSRSLMVKFELLDGGGVLVHGVKKLKGSWEAS